MFKDMKIAITDEAHLKAVCDVLESTGYSEGLSVAFDNNDEYKWVGSNSNGVFGYYMHKDPCIRYDVATLSDLLKMRDDMVKANEKVVKHKNLLAFKIWLGLLGYTVKTLQDGKAFRFRFKKQYGLVTAGNTGNSLAYKLGREFEEHLKPQ